MNKTKKLLSLFTAAALSVTAFAGLAVTASAADPLTKIDDDYTTMSATDLQAEAAKYDITTTEASQNSVKAVEGQGIQFYANLRYNFTDNYADRTFDTAYDGTDILIAGTWYTGDTPPTIGNGGRVYLSFRDTDGKEIIKFHANRNDGIYGYSINGGSEVKIGSLTSSAGSANISFNIKFDPVNNKIKAGSTINSTKIEADTDVTAVDLKTVRIGRTFVTDPKGRNVSNATLKSLNIQEVPAATTSLGIKGDSEIVAGRSADYTAAVLDQYGDDFSSEGVSLAVNPAVEGVNLEGNTVSVSNTVTAASFTLVASKDGFEDVTKTVTISNDLPYKLTTTPYSVIVIDNNTDNKINSGKTGVVDIDKTYSDGSAHSVKITKPGYEDYSGNITFAINGESTQKLTCTNGDYYEDFTNVKDNFGYTGGGTVSNGILSFTTENDETVTSPEELKLSGKLLTLNVAQHRDSANRYLYLKNGSSTVVNLYFRTTNVHLNGVQSDGTGLKVSAGNYHDVSVYIPSSSSQRMVLYVDGLKCNDANSLVSSLDTTTVTSYTASNNNKSITLNSVKVGDKPADFVLAADDIDTTDGDNTNTNITSVTYLTGYTASLTLPDPVGKDGYSFLGWTADDGATLKAAGETVTATAATTYTAVYAQTATGVILDAVTGTGDNELADTDVLEGDVNKLATPVYVTIMPDKAYSKPQIVWELTYYTDSEVGQTKRTKNVTYNTALTSGEETKLGAVFTGVNLPKYNTHATLTPSLKAILTEGE